MRDEEQLVAVLDGDRGRHGRRGRLGDGRLRERPRAAAAVIATARVRAARRPVCECSCVSLGRSRGCADGPGSSWPRPGGLATPWIRRQPHGARPRLLISAWSSARIATRRLCTAPSQRRRAARRVDPFGRLADRRWANDQPSSPNSPTRRRRHPRLSRACVRATSARPAGAAPPSSARCGMRLISSPVRFITNAADSTRPAATSPADSSTGSPAKGHPRLAEHERRDQRDARR